MITLNMIGPDQLTALKIDELIKGRSPGNYALGEVQGHAFIVKYVGRSDFNLNHSLKEWVGLYSHFKWSYAKSEEEAFDKECHNFHDFGGIESLDNHVHPIQPEGMNLKCKVCGHL